MASFRFEKKSECLENYPRKLSPKTTDIILVFFQPKWIPSYHSSYEGNFDGFMLSHIH